MTIILSVSAVFVGFGLMIWSAQKLDSVKMGFRKDLYLSVLMFGLLLITGGAFVFIFILLVMPANFGRSL